jgi:hypothetical protein
MNALFFRECYLVMPLVQLRRYFLRPEAPSLKEGYFERMFTVSLERHDSEKSEFFTVRIGTRRLPWRLQME